MAKNLIKRGDIYYANVQVPMDVRGILGRTTFQKSTKHRQLRNAEIAAAPWIAEWLQQIDEARSNPDATLERMAKLMALKREQEEHQEYWDYEYETDAEGKPTGRKHGYTDAELTIDYYLDGLDPHLKPSEVKRMKELYYGRNGIPLGLFISSWIADQYPRSTARTQAEARSAIENLIEFFPTLTDLTIRNRQRWIKSETRAVKTVTKALSFVRSYYSWLRENQHVGASEINPFHTDDIKMPKKLAAKQSYLPFTVSDVVKLRKAAADLADDKLVAFIDIAQWTGMRLAEVAQISSESVVVVDGVECLKVKADAKTTAGSNRLIPIADTLASRVPLKELPTPPAPKVNKRSNKSVPYEGQEVGKRFGRLKAKLGYSRQHVFHSIRKTAATVFEQAGVAEGITADIIGHEKQTMTYGLYSGGTSVGQRKEAVDAYEALMLQREAASCNDELHG